MIRMIAMLGLLLFTSGCAAQASRDQEIAHEKLKDALAQASANPDKTVFINLDEHPDMVQTGDLVEIGYNYTVEAGQDCPGEGSDQWPGALRYGRRSVVAGRPSALPGLRALLDMRKGDQKTIHIPSNAAYGERDASRVRTYPCRKPIPLEFLMPAAKARQGCSEGTETGRIIDLYPHIQAEVLDEDENKRIVRLLVSEGDIFEDPHGATVVHIDNGMAVFHLTPRIGAPFKAADGVGVIVSTDADNFTVDFNHPLAGCGLQLDITVHSITKASALAKKVIDWQDDPEAALGLSSKCNRPVVLVFYAGWCQWSKRLLDETLRDPLVLGLADHFIWAKTDSSEQTQYKKIYGLNTFPTILVVSPQNTAIERMEGFQSADALYSVLERVTMGVEENL